VLELPMSDTVSSRERSLAGRTLELCRIPSPIGEERALANWVEAWALKHYPSLEVRRYSNSLAVGSLSSPKASICLAGHLDTIPLHPTDVEPRIEGGRIFGRGSSDMKGGLAVMMALAESIPREGLPYNLVLLFYEREEGPYQENGLGLLYDSLPQLRTLALAIAMEPTDNVVQVGSLGSLHATLRFGGKAAHSARPWQGENAIHKAGPLLTRLLERPRNEVSFAGFPFYEVFSATKASGGRARNVVPDAFEVNLNYRFAPGKTLEQAQREVCQLVGDRAEIEFTDLAPSGRVCTANPLFQKLLSVTALPAASKQAWTDVARFSEFGVDAVNFGPGSSAEAHQQNESAPTSALAQAYEKLVAFLTTR
jgi:succinyl-diaminopimelate desuccinylase